MRIVVVPCLSDNYAYLIICEETDKAAIVDPSEAGPVAAAVDREGIELVSIWNTHHHYDHTGGNRDLLVRWPELAVIAHHSDRGRVAGQTEFVNDGDVVSVGEAKAAIMFNPGHTNGAISYFIAEQASVFTGDTLFGAGCGRMFEGNAEQMHGSLMSLSSLPSETQVYCGHEYTVNNLRFAAAVEPDNDEIAARAERARQARTLGSPTVPFSIAEERATNPFLRAEVEAVAAAARAQHGLQSKAPHAVFGALRKWKDSF